ncbi:hypothetical protein BJV38_003302 [Clostridium beijerinckii]|uniref:hypothetical protein n=1 Tax=Clostridium beijerinckii TaxID=1520 RepID=UPI00157019A1|nr:hypothetical protein [Clostridium beijerinckii]NRT34112.1 hypothetical protein [Clostridium beijerinckii]NRT46459.1 hypothetical protein [Clostridium beijerinckii]NRZ19537.1 hypothetical protein [Clostridium beijerinckii]
MISIKIILRENRGSLAFHVNEEQINKSSISQQEMDLLYDWFLNGNLPSHIVTCNDKTKMILIRNSILYAEAK